MPKSMVEGQMTIFCNQFLLSTELQILELGGRCLYLLSSSLTLIFFNVYLGSLNPKLAMSGSNIAKTIIT